MMDKRNLKEDLEYCKELEPISLEIKIGLIDALGRRAKEVNVLERWTLNAIDGWPYAIRQALEEKERADKYEALVREQENQIDILSTTLAMYCSPYYDMQERAEKAEALNRELAEALEKAIEEVNHPICGPGSVVGDLEEVLDKAKEVLRDEQSEPALS